MVRLCALVAAVVLGVLLVCGVTDPTDAERAIGAASGLIALGMLAQDHRFP